MRVDWTGSKEVKTKFGVKKVYSMKGDDSTFYSFGFKDPGVEKGDSVEFEFENDAYGNKVKFETIKITKGSGAVVEPAATASKGVGFAGRGGYTPRQEKVFPIPLTHGDRSIIRQNSLSHAVAIVNGSPFPTGTDLDETVATVIRVARKFEMYSAGDEERMNVEKRVSDDVEEAVEAAIKTRKGK